MPPWWLIRQIHFRASNCVASPDGKRVAYTSNIGQGSIWILEDF